MTQYFVCFTVNIRRSLVPCCVPNDNCSNEPGATYIGPGAGPQVITEQPVSDLHLHCHPLCHPLAPICNRHPLSFSHTAWAC